MRIRLPFAGAFIFVFLITAYAGLSSLQIDLILDDKFLHAVAFFILTTCFYWILDTSRRRALNLTLLVCTAILGVSSEILQHFITDRKFDPYDIIANIVGSLAAVALSSWYHRRMLERKRAAKQYLTVPGEEADLELGEGVGVQESGVTPATSGRSLEADLDNWDENAEDAWDEEGPAGTDSLEGEGPKTPSASSGGETENQPDMKKRVE